MPTPPPDPSKAPKPSWPLANEKYETAVQRRAAGVSKAAIARELNVSTSTVDIWFGRLVEHPIKGVAEEGATAKLIKARLKYVLAHAPEVTGITLVKLLDKHRRLVEEAANEKQFKAALDGNRYMIELYMRDPELAKTFEAEGKDVTEKPADLLLAELGGDETDE